MDECTVDKLAQVLQEPNIDLLTQVLRILGPDRTTAILADTRTCEANGGMLTKDRARRRTPGGVFFQLVKEAEQWLAHYVPVACKPSFGHIMRGIVRNHLLPASGSKRSRVSPGLRSRRLWCRSISATRRSM